MMLAGFIIACGGCSFPNMGARLQHPQDVVWAWLIVIFVISAIPVLTLCGMRFSRRKPHHSKKRTVLLTVILLVFFILSGSCSFAGMMITWIFMPLVIVTIILLNTLALAAILVVPACIYAVIKIMQRFDRKLYWNRGKVWRRLKQNKIGGSCTVAASSAIN